MIKVWTRVLNNQTSSSKCEENLDQKVSLNSLAASSCRPFLLKRIEGKRKREEGACVCVYLSTITKYITHSANAVMT